ncbi:hypothetical protein EV421DRAFT_1911715 [Armillaria borealis]|uniref:FMN-dependent dehydrogenase domain-containing protein n=1 Tax=Armillaria borealis TaxID=47425 RepID=A0AA39IXE1_9AGAR|nr:hypothetical protein EV421DRAFT_1911715 [Armillaria borealis]
MVDAPQLGHRKKDMRMKFEAEDLSKVAKAGADGLAISHPMQLFIDPGLCWSNIKWFKSITSMPLILKGIQCWKDVDEAGGRHL